MESRRPEYQGRGVGREVLERVLALRSRDAHTSLIATELGKRLYDKLGFQTIGRIHKLIADAATFQPFEGRLATRAASLDDLVARDRTVFGADRSAMLRARYTHAEECIRCVDAFAMRIRGVTQVLGPVIASRDVEAQSLIASLVGDRAGRFRIDVHERHAELVAWLRASGFDEIATPPVMSLSGSAPPGDASLVRAIASQAWG